MLQFEVGAHVFDWCVPVQRHGGALWHTARLLADYKLRSTDLIGGGGPATNSAHGTAAPRQYYCVMGEIGVLNSSGKVSYLLCLQLHDCSSLITSVKPLLGLTQSY